MSEPLPLLLAFVAHWRALGASEVTLFADAPLPGAREALAPHPWVRLVETHARFYWGWSRHDRPRAQAHRQRRNLLRAWRETRLDWIFHVDADEFLVCNRPVADLLAEVEPEADHAFVPVAERVFDGAPSEETVFGGIYRKPAPPALAEAVARIDGDAAPFLDAGLAGYPGGKSAFRVGAAITPGVHGPEPAAGTRRAVLPEARLLHFDGLSAAHWVWKKHRTMAQQPAPGKLRASIAAQRAALRATDRAGGEALYLRMKCLAPERLAALDALGLILRVPLDPSAEARALFGAEATDFRPGGLELESIEVVDWEPEPRWHEVLRGLRRRLGRA